MAQGMESTWDSLDLNIGSPSHWLFDLSKLLDVSEPLFLFLSNGPNNLACFIALL